MKIRIILQCVAIMLLLTVAYSVGYYRATINTEFMLSSLRAKISMQTLQYLEKNELDKIKSIHSTDLEACIAGVKSAIELSKYPLKNLRILYMYHESYNMNEAEKDRISNTLFKQYENLKKETT